MLATRSAKRIAPRMHVMSTGGASRPFRTEASLAAELATRDKVAPFLRSRGFTDVVDDRNVAGTAIEQFVLAIAPSGSKVKVRVRLCWRRDGRKPRERLIAAAQLRARLIGNSWEDTLRFIEDRDRAQGVTHNLFAQFDAGSFVMAALVPANAINSIWLRQRDVSAELQRRGLMGRIGKNHAMNGSSPTIWLLDERTPDAHQVSDALWTWPGVTDLVNDKVDAVPHDEDTFDDCPAPDFAMFGADGSVRHEVVRSEVRRDARVRKAVLERAAGCERPGCGTSRPFAGFLDVHHILGAEKSDRVWNCVALCPNCHREAHFASNATKINEELLAIAMRFAPPFTAASAAHG